MAFSNEMFALTVPILEKIVRPILVYAFLVLLLRVFGKRELAQLNPFDLVVLLSLSNTVQNAIIGNDNSLTGGLIASRLVNVAGASTWFRGGVVTYASQVKFDLLHVPEGPVVSPEAAKAMARGVRELFGADLGLSVTGVAGPEEQDGLAPGTVFVGLDLGTDVEHVALRLPGDRPRVRAYSAISALDALRRALDRGTSPS